MQALIDTAEYVMCTSIIMGVKLVCHEYCIIITWHKNHFQDLYLTATFADKDNPSSDTLLSGNSSNSYETFVEGASSFLMARRGIYSAHMCSVSKSHNQNANIKQNPCDVMRFYRTLGGVVLIWPH